MAYIGNPISRADGRAKVTGAAKYAAEFNEPNLAYASVVSSTITKGRILRVDTSAALRLNGVIDVLTHQHRPPMADTDQGYHDDVAPEGGSPFRPLYDGNIVFNGQPVAVVIAESSEIAREGASLVRIEYAPQAPATELERERANAVSLSNDTFALTPSRPRGDAAKAFAAAPVRHEADYLIPIEHHNPMELYGTTVVWHGDGKLTVYDKTQGVQNVQHYLCGVFGMKPEDVRVMGPYMGGGFGSGLRPQYNVALAVLAARALQRPIRLVLSRPQMYSLSYRPRSIERVALGAKADGTLDAITHDAFAMTSRFEDFARKDTIWGGALYKSPNTTFSHRLARLDVSTPGDMRAPGAASGVYALECAMDELAVALKLDPVELRIRNYSDRDQNADVPFTSKALRECYQRGAAAFGWERRNPEPRSMRDNGDLVGWGMATGIWEALDNHFTVRVVLSANGHADVTCAASDLGTGTYTVMAQVTADLLGLPIENVSVKLGDSTLPQAQVAGGSWTASSVANALANTCGELRTELLRLAQTAPGSPLANAKPEDVVLAREGIVSKRDPTISVSIADAMRRGSVERLERQASNNPSKDEQYARNTHSAIFAEVKVDEQLGVIRVTRVVSAVAAGRILNAKTARSQILGSVVMGIGMALHEETLTDHRFGRIVNANYAEYHVPVNADIHDIEVIFVDEPDTIINPLGTKGVGEIGIVGVAAAVANAVYHATGKRVRDLPITLDKLQRGTDNAGESSDTVGGAQRGERPR
jgi:xanthine dehydrogenase YagR molybdenum-binding subunit